MIKFILGILFLIWAIFTVIFLKKKMKLLSIIGFVVGGFFLISSFFGIVPTGYTGILRTMGKVEPYTLSAGLNVIKPWQDVVLMDNREQKVKYEQSAFSSDIQQVDITGSVIFSINRETAMDLYQNVGENYAEKIIYPQIAEDLKSVIAHYTAEKLIENRTKLSSEALELLRNDMSSYGLNIISVAIENIDFTDAFEAAVEAKQVATQTKQKAQTEQEQQTMEAEQAAERQRIAAQADAEVKRINADADAYETTTRAEAQAKANTQLAASVTRDLIDYTKATLWNGVLPSTYVCGDGTTPIINIPANQ